MTENTEELNQENTVEQEEFNVVLSGTLNYTIYIKDDKYKFESDVTPESEFVMIENAINALNMARSQWPVLKKLMDTHPDKKIRKQAKDSLPNTNQRMRIDAAVYELEKIRDSIIFGIYHNALNPVKIEPELEILPEAESNDVNVNE